MPDEIELWRWEIPSSTPAGKRIVTSWRMTEADARERYGDQAVKVEGSKMLASDRGSTSAFQSGPKG